MKNTTTTTARSRRATRHGRHAGHAPASVFVRLVSAASASAAACRWGTAFSTNPARAHPRPRRRGAPPDRRIGLRRAPTRRLGGPRFASTAPVLLVRARAAANRAGTGTRGGDLSSAQLVHGHGPRRERLDGDNRRTGAVDCPQRDLVLTAARLPNPQRGAPGGTVDIRCRGVHWDQQSQMGFRKPPLDSRSTARNPREKGGTIRGQPITPSRQRSLREPLELPPSRFRATTFAVGCRLWRSPGQQGGLSRPASLPAFPSPEPDAHKTRRR